MIDYSAIRTAAAIDYWVGATFKLIVGFSITAACLKYLFT